MSAILACPYCGKSVSAPPELHGKTVACPHCACQFVVPGQGAAPVIRAVPRREFDIHTTSMRFTFVCQRCTCILEGNSRMAGTTGRCPTCGAVFTVPGVDRQTGLATGPAVVADDGQHPTPVHAYASAGDKAPRIVRAEDGTQSIICPRCQGRMSVDANLCTACGMPFTIEGTAVVSRGVPSGNRFATPALVVGIISIPMNCVVVLGPAAIGLGLAAWREAKRIGQVGAGRRMALAAVILGIVSCLISTAYWLRHFGVL